MALVFSYIRFSSKRQELGDSLRRQLEHADAWMSRHPEHTLSPLQFRDLGIPSHKGQNLKKGALRRFMDAIEHGRVPPGSILLIEAVDRLSRAGLDEGRELISAILKAGVTIVSLIPAEMVIRPGDTNNIAQVTLITMTLYLGWLESAQKSERVGRYWAGVRAKFAAGDTTPIDTKRPSWIDWDKVAKKFTLNAGAEAVRHVYRRTAEGAGRVPILRELQKDFAPIGRSRKWNQSWINAVLADRTVVGERVPHRFDSEGNLVPAGEAVVGYYPAAVTETEWAEAQRGRRLRAKRVGREANGHVNLFKGIIKNANDSCPMHIQSSPDGRGGRQLRYVSYASKRHEAGADRVSVAVADVERHVLGVLAEIDPSLLEAKAGTAEALRQREAVLAALDERIAELEAEMGSAGGRPVRGLAKALEKLEADREAEAREVERLKLQAHADSPLPHCREVLRMLEDAPPEKLQDLRVRLRGLVAELVSVIWVKPERHYGRVWGLVQIHFANGYARGAMIGPGLTSHPGEVWPTSELPDLQKSAGRAVLGEFAKLVMEPAEVPEPDTVAVKLQAAGEQWLGVVRSRMGKASYRVVPSKVRRFLDVVGGDTPTAKLDAKKWAGWVAWLKRAVEAEQLEPATARVSYARSREFVRWVVEKGGCAEFPALKVSAAKALG